MSEVKAVSAEGYPSVAHRIAALEARCAKALAEGALLREALNTIRNIPPFITNDDSGDSHIYEADVALRRAPLAEAAARVIAAAKCWADTTHAPEHDPVTGPCQGCVAENELDSAVEALLALESQP